MFDQLPPARGSSFVCLYTAGGDVERVFQMGNAPSAARSLRFFDLCDQHSRKKALELWETVLRAGAAFDWSLNFERADSQTKSMRITAAAVDGNVLVLAGDGDDDPSRPAAVQTYDELSGIVNELSIAHRQAAKSAARMRVAMETERKGRERSEELQNRLRFLAHAGQTFAESVSNVADFVDTVLALAVPMLGEFCTIAVSADVTTRVARGKHNDPHLQTALDRALQHDSPEDALSALCAGDLLQLPLATRRTFEGRMLIGRASHDHTDDERALAEQFANIVSVALDNSLSYERQRSISEELQRALLPAALPSSPWFVMDAIYRRGGEGPEYLGGDWYDAFILPDGALAVSIGDVTGHGVYAAAAMGKVRHVIRAGALNEREPRRVLQSASRLLCFEQSVATALYGRLEAGTRTFSYAIAGHPPPVLARGRDASLLPHGGSPMGLDDIGGSEPGRYDIRLEAGDSLIFYTDGLVEARRDINAGFARLLEAVRASHAGGVHGTGTSKSLVEAVLGTLEAADDIAVLSLHITS